MILTSPKYESFQFILQGLPDPESMTGSHSCDLSTCLTDTVVEALSVARERRLRHLEWIEKNRKKVEEMSNGDLGYIYMPNTGQDGQTELLRQFYAQFNKKGFIIDERFNAGGQLGDRFIEMLNRTNLYNISSLLSPLS